MHKPPIHFLPVNYVDSRVNNSEVSRRLGINIDKTIIAWQELARKRPNLAFVAKFLKFGTFVP